MIINKGGTLRKCRYNFKYFSWKLRSTLSFNWVNYKYW